MWKACASWVELTPENQSEVVTILKVSQVPAVKGILSNMKHYLKKDHGYIQRIRTSIMVPEGTLPILQKARPVPYVLKKSRAGAAVTGGRGYHLQTDPK